MASVRRWHFSKDMKEVRKPARWVTERRMCQRKGTPKANALRQAPILLVQGPRDEFPEQRGESKWKRIVEDEGQRDNRVLELHQENKESPYSLAYVIAEYLPNVLSSFTTACRIRSKVFHNLHLVFWMIQLHTLVQRWNELAGLCTFEYAFPSA